MKITKTRLKQIIKEELARILHETNRIHRGSIRSRCDDGVNKGGQTHREATPAEVNAWVGGGEIPSDLAGIEGLFIIHRRAWGQNWWASCFSIEDNPS